MSSPERVVKAEKELEEHLARNICSSFCAIKLTKLIRNLIDERVLHLMKSEGFLKKFMDDK